MEDSKSVAVVGLGQIGGSIAKDLAGRGYAVFGIDPDPETRLLARESGVFARVTSNPSELDLDIDTVFLAAPPLAIYEMVCDLDFMPRAKYVTDCASVKDRILSAVPPARQGRFVGGHPMAGNEGVGFLASREGLFKGCNWVLCPSPSAPDALGRISDLVAEMGARPVLLDAAEHDEAVALFSHLPNVLATLLLVMSHGVPAEVAAGSWASATRVGGSNPELWLQILLMNGVEVEKSIDDLVSRLQAFRQALGEPTTVELWRRAAEIKKNRGW